MSSKVCSEADCDRPAKARGRCWRHYHALRRQPGFEAQRQPALKICSAENCGQWATARGLCAKHYRERQKPRRKRFQRRCFLPGCRRKHEAKALCKMHWQRWRKGIPLRSPLPLPRGRKAAPLEQRKDKPSLCGVAGCSNPPQLKGWCRKHYKTMYARSRTVYLDVDIADWLRRRGSLKEEVHRILRAAMEDEQRRRSANTKKQRQRAKLQPQKKTGVPRLTESNLRAHQQRLKRLRYLRKRKKSIFECAQELRVSDRTICRWLQKMEGGDPKHA